MSPYYVCEWVSGGVVFSPHKLCRGHVGFTVLSGETRPGGGECTRTFADSWYPVGAPVGGCGGLVSLRDWAAPNPRHQYPSESFEWVVFRERTLDEVLAWQGEFDDLPSRVPEL